MKQDGLQVGGPGSSTAEGGAAPVRRRKHHASITARRNWRKALDDIKHARQSGVYDLVKNESEERNERERVKSILQSNSPPLGERRISFFPGDATVRDFDFMSW